MGPPAMTGLETVARVILEFDWLKLNQCETYGCVVAKTGGF